MNLHKKTILETPIGVMVAVADDKLLYLLEFADRLNLDKRLQLLSSNIPTGRTKPLDTLQEELALYFAGTLREFKTPVHLSGTPFQECVWEELLKIPYGKTISYAKLATRIGKPAAFRAVAGANGANKLAIIVPCHRVIYANGGLGGYSGGLARKPQLLAVESASVIIPQ
jgi:AraC family transcriptional regulator of adaptative response/methylated-DNA-[protein]-cysteine methyltransferase